MKRDTMTIKQHRDFGIAVQTARNEVVNNFKFFPTSSKPHKALERAEAALNHLKCVMDGVICGVLPDSDKRATRFYYGDETPILSPEEEAEVSPSRMTTNERVIGEVVEYCEQHDIDPEIWG